MQARFRSHLIQYLLFHLLLLVLLGILLLYHALTVRLMGYWIVCPMHDLFHLYCPFCGGTRAVLALLRLDLAAAFWANPVLVASGFLFLFFDLRALFRLLSRRSDPFRLPRYLLPAIGIAFLAFCLLRNLLLVVFGFDPVGDLVSFWK